MPTLFGQGWGTAAQSYEAANFSALANGSARTGPILTLSDKTLLDVLIFIRCKVTAGAVADPKIVGWFAAGTVDGGTTFSGGAAANATTASFSSDLSIYPNVRFGMPLAFQVYNVFQYAGPFSLAALFGYVLPTHVILGLHNQTGQALTTSATDNYIQYQTVHTQA